MGYTGPKHVIGVDIGTDAVKAVLIERRDQSVVCLGTEIVQLPPVSAEASDPQRPQQIRDALIAIKTKFGSTTTQAATMISDRAMQLKFFNKPDMPPEYLKTALANEMTAQLGDHGKDTQPPVWMTTILGKTKLEDGQRTQLHCLGAIVPRQLLLDLQAQFAEAGLQLISACPYPIVMRELLKASVLDPRPADADQPTLIGVLDLGASTSQIAVLDQSLLYLARIFPSAGEDLTHSLCHPWQVGGEQVVPDREQAENLKREIGVLTLEEQAQYQPDSLEAQITTHLSRAIERMAQKFRLSLDYLKGQLRVSVNDVYLIGGGATMRGIGRHLDDLLLTRTHQLNPLSRITFAAVDQQVAIPTPDQLSVLANAFGSALTAIIPEEDSLNLMSLVITRRMKVILETLRQQAVPAAIFAAAALPVLLYYLLIYRPETGLIAQLIQRQIVANREWSELEPLKAKFDKLQSAQKDLNVRSVFLEQRVGRRVFWSKLLGEIGTVMPEGVWLRQLHTVALPPAPAAPARPGTKPATTPAAPAAQFEMIGVAFSFAELARFIQKLEDSNSFATVKWEEHQPRSQAEQPAVQPRVQFKIVCTVPTETLGKK